MSLPYPRAAVAITVMQSTTPPRFLLAQRTKPPSTGAWTLPGGKIELGERALAAAARELHEETSLGPPHVRFHPLAFAHTDVIAPCRDGERRYHFTLLHMLALGECQRR